MYNFYNKNKEKIQAILYYSRKVAMVVAILMVSYMFGSIVKIETSIPNLKLLKNYDPVQTSKIYDRNNKLIANVHGEENRTLIALEDVPEYVKQALIASEDNSFYQHHGVDPKGIFRAIFIKKFTQGGSTLTQQLVKNIFLSKDRTLVRKIIEIQLALQIETIYTKDEILSMYLNQVYFGHNAYGIESASQNYFGVSANKLDLAQAAMLIGLLPAPEAYSPYRSKEKAYAREHIVLGKMVELGVITEQEKKEAEKEVLNFPGIQYTYHKAPYFTEYVLSQIKEKFGDEVANSNGLSIYTTLDLDATVNAQNVIEQALNSDLYKKTYEASQAAVVVMDPNNGEIRVMVGGVNFAKSNYNRVIHAHRQPGSTFKPFIYYSALKNKVVSPDTIIIDEPMEYDTPQGKWKPQNYDKIFRGSVTVREAIENSINIIAVKVIERTGPSKVMTDAHKAGIVSPLEPNFALALGVSEVTPLELTNAYCTFANGGKYVAPVSILKIEDKEGKLIYEYKPAEPVQVLDRDAVDILNNLLMSVVQKGTGIAASAIGRMAAGKTGTTDDDRNAWFVGYTPNLVGVVWLGNDNNKPMKNAFGGNACAPLWVDVMKVALRDEPVMFFPEDIPYTPIVFQEASSSSRSANFTIPFIVNGSVSVPTATTGGSKSATDLPVIDVTICKISGKIATDECKGFTETKKFVSGTEPTELCPLTAAEHK